MGRKKTAAEKPTPKKSVRTVTPSKRGGSRVRASRPRFTNLLTSDIPIVDGGSTKLYHQESDGYQKWTEVTLQAVLQFDSQWDGNATFQYVLKKLKNRRFLRGHRDDLGQQRWEIMTEDAIYSVIKSRFDRCCESVQNENGGKVAHIDSKGSKKADTQNSDESTDMDVDENESDPDDKTGHPNKRDDTAGELDSSESKSESEQDKNIGSEDALERALWNAADNEDKSPSSSAW
eukprot:CAMPEP_0172439796 /NCGR_PEP_ID=MMETSP1065-20121228/667_1 /TAXON_ID=265537 /ORGANISM="Amphiprora paludosa, Strain CCMP125" /LENGTH=232 /DNA_ID=CAMNT_0013188531 /DNA_START=48 /DNA_END=743 /DNA_ORIENTATION=-